MIASTEITAAILAGGKSRRMATDKALLDLGGQTFIQRIAAEAARTVERVIIIADHHENYAFLHVPSYPDVIPGGGPLGGIHSALVHAPTPFVFIISCDLPLITSDMMKEVARRARKRSITVVSDGSHILPLFGIYPKVLAGAIETTLRSGERRVLEFLKSQKVHVVDCSSRRTHLRNINTLKDYQDLLRAGSS